MEKQYGESSFCRYILLIIVCLFDIFVLIYDLYDVANETFDNLFYGPYFLSLILYVMF